MQAIETWFEGIKYRSRTEARWAVFFQRAGLRTEYEKEGVVLNGSPYLPDFWLPEIGLWFEVKGTEPTAKELGLCRLLAEQSGHGVLLAVGSPDKVDQIIQHFGNGERAGVRFHFAYNRDDPYRLKLQSADGAAWQSWPGHNQQIDIDEAYQAAKSARFEFGQSGGQTQPKSDKEQLSYDALQRRARYGWIPDRE